MKYQRLIIAVPVAAGLMYGVTVFLRHHHTHAKTPQPLLQKTVQKSVLNLNEHASAPIENKTARLAEAPAQGDLEPALDKALQNVAAAKAARLKAAPEPKQKVPSRVTKSKSQRFVEPTERKITRETFGLQPIQVTQLEDRHLVHEKKTSILRKGDAWDKDDESAPKASSNAKSAHGL